MALDATIGGASSDTYATLAGYTAYALAMGWTLTGDTATQEANLRRARMVLDQSYVWLGIRVNSSQALQWPRYINREIEGYTVPTSTIPSPVIDAQCEMAYAIQGGADPFGAISKGAVTGERQKVDVIETQTTYAESTARDRVSYPAVDLLVGPYITAKAGQRSGSVGLSRV